MARLCECGCGQPTPLAVETGAGYRKGEAKRFVHGHHNHLLHRPLYDRWFEKVEKTDTCWIWHGAITSTGYGVIRMDQQRRNVRAHRFAYEHFTGPIPEGLEIRHSCHNRACVNPAHLSVGTRADNMRDMVQAGRSRRSRKG